ncbi:MAG: hypothetical protein H6823_17605 [Planctomycetaceae bacterium]|nr:hypothetical protein [Planctomycetales bacterium]MCB9940058.1 hypothetical protein [Planctomycetaceae bacterium]
MANAHSGFWVDGEEIYADTLRQERDERIAELGKRQELATSTTERDQLADELKQVHETYKKKLAEMRWLLF